MKYKILIQSGIKKHKGAFVGIFALVLLVFAFLCTVLNVWTNADRYIQNELTRAGFGELTAWVSGVPDISELVKDMEDLSDVERVETQNLIFSSYTANEENSDSEGQLIPYSQEKNRYRFFTDDLSGYLEKTPDINQGDVYVSPSLISIFGIKLGDSISFAIARNGEAVTLKVRGYYEDPFMGSAMIGMKGFLISWGDYNQIAQIIQKSGIAALAREGAMFHVFKENESQNTTAQLNSSLNMNTQLSQYAEFVHSFDAIAGFMLILQKVFSGLLLAFVLVLIAVIMVALGHSISGIIEADYVNMGILKTMGITTNVLYRVGLIQQLLFIVSAMVVGLALSAPLSVVVSNVMLTTSGVRVPTNIPWWLYFGAFAVILLPLTVFIMIKTVKIKNITPLKAIHGETEKNSFKLKKNLKICGNHIGISIAIRQLVTGRRKYMSACIVAVLLTFFAFIVGSMSSWLGADGKGLMEAFNPADHDIGVQIFGNSSQEDVRSVVLDFTDITDEYLLAMPGVAVNGIDFTVNVISQPSRFHILSGETCFADNEIVVTEFVAADLGVTVGDTLNVVGNSGSEEYIITGIYSCANEMGANIGMNAEGYLKIGKNDPQIWCYHYFLANETQKPEIINELNKQFGGDVHIHENTWPGLFGIITAMQMLVAFMYIMVLIFIFIVTAMTGSKILASEQRDIGIYKAIGFNVGQLRLSFAVRFGIVAFIGSAIGVLLGLLFTERLVSAVMKFTGISNFTSNPNVVTILLPFVVVTMLFMGFAYLVARKIKKTDLTILINE